MNLQQLVLDALKDSASLLLPLFIIFVIIEIFEGKFVEKISLFRNITTKFGPILGALFAIIPQCGFSVIATVLYIKKFLSLGTLIAIYIATSDEAIPILINYPNQYISLVKIIAIKVILAICVGYVCDLIFKQKIEKIGEDEEVDEKGCCDHEISTKKKREYILHPIKHTMSVFLFIFAVCLALNILLAYFGLENVEKYLLNGSFLQPIIAGFIGIIPNCAVSVLITMLYIKEILGLPSVVSGLSAGGGLGLLVLIKQNKDIKNTLLIISILLLSSIGAGCILQLF